ncbi:MAG: hypothetical protein ACE5ER_00155 [Nitrospinaceae bacterium]
MNVNDPPPAVPDLKLAGRPPKSNAYGLVFRIFLGMGLVFLAACTSWKVAKAFNGEFSPAENNRVINDYCQNCHIHKTFSASTHLDVAPQGYNRKVFRYATECRVCHFLEISVITEKVTRKTRMPKDANRGDFRDFEIEMLKSQRDQRRLEEEGGEKSFFGLF